MASSKTNPDMLRVATHGVTLRRFLNCYWLRPENAFWMALRSQSLEQTPLTAPCVDLSCGDGIFSFLHAGGDFDVGFDVFSSVAYLDKVRDDHADMFDHADETYQPVITKHPPTRMAAGTDWKQALLHKAGALGFYESLVLHDNNHPLPFEDASFATVHCNSAYWVRKIDLFLREMRRVLRPDGHALLSVKLDAIRRYTLESFRDRLGERWLEIIGRGRFESWPTVGDLDIWAGRFKSAGFTIASAKPFITRTHAQIWDIGLRPIAPMLIRMAGAIDSDTRQAIKADWIELMTELLLPITRPDFNLFGGHDEPAEVLFDLTPS